MREKIPLVCAVIPQKLDSDTAQFLRFMKKRFPALLDITQHGWTHKNYGDNKTRYEFGANRNYSEQKKDIADGLAKMVAEFGAAFTPAFIPPYNYYDLNTLKICRGSGFKIFSAGAKKHCRIAKPWRDFPAAISFNSYDSKFRSKPADLSVIIKQVLGSIKDNEISGIHFHYSTLDNYNFNKFAQLVYFIKNLRDSGAAKLANFTGLLKRVA